MVKNTEMKLPIILATFCLMKRGEIPPLEQNIQWR